jgi:glycine cleavage system H protein
MKEEIMSTLRYTRDHEYISVNGDIGTVGITDFAQNQLGDVVFVELPQCGDQLTQGQQAAVVESVKAASEVYAPVAGEIIEVNTALESEPAKVNEDPLGSGWFLKIKIADPAQINALMDDAAYKTFTASLG